MRTTRARQGNGRQVGRFVNDIITVRKPLLVNVHETIERSELTPPRPAIDRWAPCPRTPIRHRPLHMPVLVTPVEAVWFVGDLGSEVPELSLLDRVGG